MYFPTRHYLNFSSKPREINKCGVLFVKRHISNDEVLHGYLKIKEIGNDT